MIRQLTVPITSVEKIPPDYFVVGLKALHVARETRPGQFVMLRIPAGNLLWGRAYSIYDTDADTIFIFFKVVGRGTKLLSQENIGDTVEVIGPLGNSFTPPAADEISVLAGGSVGLVPLYFFVKTYRKNVSRMRVLIGARNKENVILEKEFKNLGCQVEVSTDDGSYGVKGLVTDLLENSIRNNFKLKNLIRIYACGPKAMLKAVGKIGIENGIRTELSLEASMACGLGVCLGCAVKTRAKPEQKAELRSDYTYTRLCCDGPILEASQVLWE